VEVLEKKHANLKSDQDRMIAEEYHRIYLLNNIFSLFILYSSFISSPLE